ncbi:MAG TPA: hypothetical protein PKO25_06530 [Spirochaetota bacterium]|nr:hypothetical protein [Spirochaetota bacterium]OPZ38815.1 MAG: hypothetical protein BWY96_00773 [Spirochaetes bacterium ADurb.BinA120]HNU91511.1 hypothetical protein [Spirochaetota bacterium]HPI13548.1 hypothetical protein [Spirochaetota bacterium]HPV98043.1 hypothetical protein [Spirochaetota bacterium]
MIALFFIAILQVSFVVHIYYLVSYISRKQDRFFKGFLTTAITNIFIGIFLAVLVLINPAEVRALNLDRVLFIESGLIFFLMLAIKGRVSVRIYRRSQDPQHYHYSYFGKKVIHASAVTSRDLLTYFLTLPLTLICGAYFVVKLGCGR